jgi:ATP-binding cassette subfamily A (ABC1) protein 3
MLSTFFDRANTAAAAGGIVFFLTYVPYFFLQPRYTELSLGSKLAASLLSNVAMALGGQIIGMWEGTGIGVQWSNIAQPVSVDDNLAMIYVIGMLLLDSVLYTLIALYVEAVWPGQFGIPQPWYFPFVVK